MHEDSEHAGFSLLEVLVGLAAGAILIYAVTRFYKDSYRTYNLQEQIADRDQNAHYTLKKITEVLQQAGSGLPPIWSVVGVTGSPPHNTFTLAVNPYGGEYFVTSVTPAPALNKIPVADTVDFRKATHVIIDYAGADSVLRQISSKINGTTPPLDTLVITPNLTRALSIGDVAYAYRQDAYLISSNNFIYRPENNSANDVVLAENVDSLGVTFYRQDGVTTTTTSSLIYSAKIAVRARVPTRDPRWPLDGGYRSVRLKMNVRLRNKV